MTKIIAVTGATGFVGKHLVRALVAHGFQVRALTRRPMPPSSNITWIAGDLENRPALASLAENADVFIHLAGLIKAKTPPEFYQVNSHGVKTVLEVIRNSSARPHFILLSSLAAREEQLSSYAQSKRQGEENLIKYSADLPWTILRPPAIYGPEDMEILKIFKSITWRLALIPARPDNRVSWIYAPDLARAIIAVCQNQTCFGKILDVDDGRENGYSHREMYQIAANILNITPLHFIMPRPALKTLAGLNVLFSTFFGYTPMLTPEKVNELCHPDWICRGPHVMRITAWKPETDMKQGFGKTLQWYKKNNLL
ncbi:MAG: NAD(P)-dependent oxidoreductase [Alphaproteobacteria bacterium]|nr:NAD(P)-dependent oxidoreductase [Alphaproteobacteria bacterium]